MAYIKEYWQNKEQRAETARKHTKEDRQSYKKMDENIKRSTKHICHNDR